MQYSVLVLSAFLPADFFYVAGTPEAEAEASDQGGLSTFPLPEDTVFGRYIVGNILPRA